VPYIVAQVVGAILAGFILMQIASGRDVRVDPNAAGAFASNGYGALSPGGYSVAAAFLCEVVMTAMFLTVILGATSPRAPAGFAPIAIGLALTLIHLISIPVTNTSVNPARSTASRCSPVQARSRSCGCSGWRRSSAACSAATCIGCWNATDPARSKYDNGHVSRRGRLLSADASSRASERLEAAFLEIDERLHDFLLGVHHERTVARHRLAQRPARDEDQSRFLAGPPTP
jgi:hypothetical protein